MVQPCSGNFSDFALRQPSEVLPSHNNFQPAFCSSAVNVFGSTEISRMLMFLNFTCQPAFAGSLPTW